MNLRVDRTAVLRVGRITLLWGWSLLLMTSVSVAASFDCSDTSKLTETEQAVCLFEPISKLDEILTEEYRALLKEAPNKKYIIAQQRRWLKYRENYYMSCGGIDSSCDQDLAEFYERRIARLKEIRRDNKLIDLASEPFTGYWTMCDYYDSYYNLDCMAGEGYKLIQSSDTISGEWYSGGGTGGMYSGIVSGKIEDQIAKLFIDAKYYPRYAEEKIESFNWAVCVIVDEDVLTAVDCEMPNEGKKKEFFLSGPFPLPSR